MRLCGLIRKVGYVNQTIKRGRVLKNMDMPVIDMVLN